MELLLFETVDLILAASLLEKGERLAEVKTRNGKTAIFRFEDNPSLRELVRQFLEDEIQVRPLSFTMSWKKLRTMVSNCLAGGGKA